MLRVWWNVLAIGTRPDRSPLPAPAARLHRDVGGWAWGEIFHFESGRQLSGPDPERHRLWLVPLLQ